MTLRLVLFCLLTTVWAAVAHGQNLDMDAWSKTATRAEATIESPQASDKALAALRATLADWRENFVSARAQNAARLDTLNQQLKALGAAPVDGTTEPEVIATRRAELKAEIDRLGTPRLAAIEAFARADGLIGEIDDVLDARRTRAFLNRGAVPLVPSFWADAASDLSDSFRKMAGGVVGAMASPAQRKSAVTQVPFVVLMLALAGFLLIQSRNVLQRMTYPIAKRKTPASVGFAGFITTLGMGLSAGLAVYLIILAIEALGFYAVRGDAVLKAMPLSACLLIVGWRVSDALSGISDGRRLKDGAFWLSAVLALRLLILPLVALDAYAANSRVVIEFAFVVAAAIAMFIIGRSLLGIKGAEVEASDTPRPTPLRETLRRYIALTLVVLACVTPALAAVGFGEAASRILFPAAYSFGLLAALIIVFEAVRDFYGWLRGLDGRTNETLTPVMVNTLIGLGSLPAFALIWGVRQSTLAEVWTRFKTGVTLGETTISPGVFVTLLVVFIIGYLITRAIQRALAVNVLPRTKMDAGGQTALISGIGYLGIFLAALIAITSAGIDLSSLAIVAGALSVGIGFGLQNIVSNFVSGIILLIERPISEGDWIEVGSNMGIVRDISVRSTRIETFDKSDVIVPNADFVSGTVTNYTKSNTTGRIILNVGVAYGSDSRKVADILLEIVKAHPMVLLNPGPSVVFSAFGADSLDFEVRAILRDVNWGLSVRTELNHQILEAFTKNGIEIPFVQRDIWIRNPEDITAKKPQ